MTEEISEYHYTNIGLFILPNGQYKPQKACWCHINKLLKAEELIAEEIKSKHGIIKYYRPLRIREDEHRNRFASSLLKKQISGPIFILAEDRDISIEDIKVH